LVLLVKQKNKRLFHNHIKLSFNKIVSIQNHQFSIHKYLLTFELLAFVNEMKGSTFVGSCAADHLQNQHFRSEQNKALEAMIFNKSENRALIAIPQP
jgi:hypothetical protein